MGIRSVHSELKKGQSSMDHMGSLHADGKAITDHSDRVVIRHRTMGQRVELRLRTFSIGWVSSLTAHGTLGKPCNSQSGFFHPQDGRNCGPHFPS